MTDIKPMENKDIDKAAREYASRNGLYPDDSYTYLLRYRTYLSWYKRLRTAVSQSRQPEIDELIEALEEMYKACSNIEAMNTHGNGKAALIRNYAQLWWPKATQLLEKYGKKDESVKLKE